jgi:quercetin dioxygenase-like cupin family protein
MRKLGATFIALAAAMAAVVTVHAQDDAIQLLPDQIKWTALPPDVTSGATWMLLVGPLDKPVHYTLRVRLEKGGMVTPHTHPDARYVTVLSGEVYAGMGDGQ